MYRFLPPRLIILLGAAALIDIYVLSWFFPAAWKPDLWVIILVYYYLFYLPRWSAGFALLLGFYCDLLGRGVFGISMISMLVAACLLGQLSHTLNRERGYVQIMVVFAASLTVGSVELLATAVWFKKAVWAYTFFGSVFTSACVTAFVSPFAIALLEKTLGSSPHQYELFPR